MVDLMSLLRDVLVCSLQVWMLNDFGKNMFPYRVEPLWKRIGVYFAAALYIFIANHMGTTLFNIAIIPASYTIAAIIIFQGSKWKKVIMACCYYMLAIVPEFLFAAITEAYGITGTANEFQSELEKTLAILLMKTMTFLLVKCINQITRKKNYLTIENKLFTVLLTLPVLLYGKLLHLLVDQPLFFFRNVKLHLYISLSVFHFRTAFRYKGLGLSQQAFSANGYSFAVLAIYSIPPPKGGICCAFL